MGWPSVALKLLDQQHHPLLISTLQGSCLLHQFEQKGWVTILRAAEWNAHLNVVLCAVSLKNHQHWWTGGEQKKEQLSASGNEVGVNWYINCMVSKWTAVFHKAHSQHVSNCTPVCYRHWKKNREQRIFIVISLTRKDNNHVIWNRWFTLLCYR